MMARYEGRFSDSTRGHQGRRLAVPVYASSEGSPHRDQAAFAVRMALSPAGETVKELQNGARVYYVLPRNRDRPKAVFLPATVIHRTSPGRVTIRLDFKPSRLRSVSPCSVCFDLPPGASEGW